MKKPVSFLVTAFLSYFIAANNVHAAEPLHWAGCGITKKAFMARLAQTYKRKTGIDISIDGGGATKGIRKVASLDTEIGGSCRPRMADSDEEIGVKMIPVAWDALVFITHKDNPVKNITLKQAKGLFEGKITNWKQLGGADKPVSVYARHGKISGVGYTVRDLIYNDLDKNFVANKFFPSSGPLEKAIEANPLAIAITGISSAKKRDVSIMTLEGRAPTYDNIVSGSYALYRPLYLIKNSLHPRRKEVSDFIDFAVSKEGRMVIKRSGTVPYFDGLALIRKMREQREGRLL